MQPITTIRSRTLHVDADNVDTDQIIPARFLKTTSRLGLGMHLFADRRGSPGIDLDDPDARILVAGRNFGCGSSREHAAWALTGFGIRAVVAPSVADIFAANAVKNGIVPVCVDEPMHRALRDRRHAVVVVDLPAGTVAIEGGPSARFALDPFARELLVRGMDELTWLLSHEEAIAAYERGERCAP
jgi:3-isopropylmalate/(R)-2-methylmalate dehydratase small subunit